MSRKGRRGRTNRAGGSKRANASREGERSPSAAPDPVRDESRDPIQPHGASLSEGATERAPETSCESEPPSGPLFEEPTPPPIVLDAVASTGPVPTVPVRPPEFEVPFFDELPTESWLAHGLELRDPRFVLKMTDTMARRRAHFTKYVVGVVGVSAALCLAAIVKAAVPTADDHAPAAAESLPAPLPPPVAPARSPADGG